MQTRPEALLFKARASGIEVRLQHAQLEIALDPGRAEDSLMDELRSGAAGLRSCLVRHQSEKSSASHVLDRFSACVAAWPDRLALLDEKRSFTYAQLDQAANHLAHSLLAAHVGIESRVGLLCPRGTSWVIAILAILKAGATYVALGTHLPAEQVAQRYAEGLIEWILGPTELLEALRPLALPSPRLLDLTRMADAGESQSGRPPAVSVHPSQLAYVILTSGSTGAPKAVAVEHRALDHFVSWYIAEYDLRCSGTRVTQMATESFDAHVLEMMPALCAGATLVLVPEAIRLDVHSLQRYLESCRITHCFLSTPIGEAFLASAHPALTSSLTHLMIGGDVLRRHPTGEWSCEISNLYGPAEAAIVATQAYITSVPAAATALPPIGLPIRGVRADILDEELIPVLQGAPGELHLSGPTLARGYLDDPRETALRFMPDPLGRHPGARCYRTGDLVLLRADGQLQYLARKDQQLKVRGIRVDPGGVEAALLSHPEVAEAAVVAHAELPDTLTAFCRLREPTGLDPAGDLNDWRALYDELYGRPSSDPAADEFAGWRSSLSGQPIPLAQMREWAEGTARRILGCGGKRVLEIGCGTGIVLSRILATLDRYDGIDLSAASLELIRRRLAMSSTHCTTSVRLFQLAAHELDQLPPGCYDTIVMNSVTQYLPDAAYLTRVLDAALERLAPGGTLFIGDVRDLRLAQAFAGYIHANGSNPPASDVELQRRVRLELEREEELLLSPEFFTRWAHSQPRIATVLLAPREGIFDNEMNRYRFDAILRASGEAPSGTGTAVRADVQLDWPGEKTPDGVTSLHQLRELLRRAAGRSLQIRGIPRAPTCSDTDAVVPAAALDECARADLEGRLFLNGEPAHRFGLQAVTPGTAWPLLPEFTEPSQSTANEPARRRRATRLTAQVRSHVKRQLADYLVPGRIVALEHMPLTPNGKIDRQRLAHWPLPWESRSIAELPQTPAEQFVARWLSETLHVQVNRPDSLWDLGGHSLLAMRLAAYISDTLGIDFQVQRILRQPTVQAIALELETALGGTETAAAVFEILSTDESPCEKDGSPCEAGR